MTTQDPFLSQVPPQSIEAEESILSAILMDPDILNDIAAHLNPEDFYRSAHEKIYGSMRELFNRGEPVDLVTLTNALRDSHQLDEVGGAVYLARLMNEVPMSVNPEHHAGIIRDKAHLRRLIQEANKIVRRCFEDQGDVSEVVDYAESAIFKVAESAVKSDFTPLNQLMVENMKTLEIRNENKSILTGLPTGFSRLNELTAGLQPSDLIILAARPSMGKTALALNLTRNVAIEGSMPVAFFSLEMPKEQLSMRLLCAEAKADASALRTGFFTKDLWPNLHKAAGSLYEAPIYIDDTPNLSVMEIRGKSRRLKKDKGLGMIVIDYLQLMRSSASVERRDLEISEISRSLKGLAKELKVPIIALSQLNRKLEDRAKDDKRPQLSDLRESGALEQDADLVMFIYRDEVYDKRPENPRKGLAELIIAKHRNGPLGTVYLTFLGASNRFETAALEAYPAIGGGEA
jgi:replicative DNA helicase